MNEQGRVVIPAGVRKQLGLRPGVRLVLRVDQGGLVLVPEDAIKQKLWAMFEGLPFSMSEQLIQERAHEAQLQNKQ